VVTAGLGGEFHAEHDPRATVLFMDEPNVGLETGRTPRRATELAPTI
jgi:hypothetical protein